MLSKAAVLLCGFPGNATTGYLQSILGICRTWAILSLFLVPGVSWSSSGFVFLSEDTDTEVKGVMQVYTGVAVADLPHAHKSLEWNAIPGVWDVGSQIQGLLSLSPCWESLLSLQCVICSSFKDWWSECGGGLGPQYKDWNPVHSWRAQSLYVYRLPVRWRLWL